MTILRDPVLRPTIDKKKPSIDHVANLANVSRITVARVFSNPSLVSEKTRNTVLKASRMLNYKTNHLARALAGGKTQTMGVLWNFSGNPDAADITGRITVCMQKRGYMAHISSFNGEPRSTLSLLTEYVERRLEAVVIQAVDDWLLHNEIRDLLSHFPAVVLVTDELKPLPYDQIIQDRLGAFRQVADHFAKVGRKRPGLVMGTDAIGDRKKREAFIGQLKIRGLQIEDPLFSMDSGAYSADMLWQLLEKNCPKHSFPYDAVMCGNDEIAMCLISWLHQQGLRVPEDVAVVGFNNSTTSRFYNPPMASVDRQVGKTVNAVEQAFFERLTSPDSPLCRTAIPMEFVWRESAG
jgi:DNA-binding LacI/PurR family transcriptional regulator